MAEKFGGHLGIVLNPPVKFGGRFIIVLYPHDSAGGRLQ